MSELLAAISSLIAILSVVPAAFVVLRVVQERSAASKAKRHAEDVARRHLGRFTIAEGEPSAAVRDKELLKTFEELHDTRLADLPPNLISQV